MADMIDKIHEKVRALMARHLDGRVVVVTRDGMPEFAGVVSAITMKREGWKCRYTVSIRDVTEKAGPLRARGHSFEYPLMKWNRRRQCWEVPMP